MLLALGVRACVVCGFVCVFFSARARGDGRLLLVVQLEGRVLFSILCARTMAPVLNTARQPPAHNPAHNPFRAL